MNYELCKLLENIKGRVVINIDGVYTDYDNSCLAIDSLTGKYKIESILAKADKVVIELIKDNTIPNDLNTEWVQKQIKETDQMPTFF